MTLVEGIGSKFLPVAPYLLKYGRIVSIFLSALDKFRFHGIYDGLLLLSHGLTQSIALTAGEIGQLS